jgi:D-threo-aldose 1-dehydrogenase
MRISATRPIGRTGLKATVASLGGGALGNFLRQVSNAEAADLLAAAWNAGIRSFDTAPFYGRGRSERRLGAFLEGKPRHAFVLTTKVGRLLTPARDALQEDGIFVNPAPFNCHYDYSYDGVMRSFESSLQRLGLDRIDMLLVHDIGPLAHGPNADTQLQILRGGGLKALEELRKGAAIKGYGLGVNEIQTCRECLDYADPDLFLLAGRFTLLEQDAAKPLLDACAKRSVAVMIGGAVNSGILATGAVPEARYNYFSAPPEIVERVRRIEAVCTSHNVPLIAAALQFPLSHPAVATVVLGPGTVSSLEKCVAGFGQELPRSLWEDLVAEGLLGAVPSFL